MSRPEPPPLAVWMLEHLAPTGRDEAVAGDLLETFRLGRSDAWYWRQSLTAFLVAWSTYLAARRDLLIFAFLWSMLAPAWATLVDRLQSHSSIPSLVIWLPLNFAFLWAGIAFYFGFFARSRHAIRRPLLRACRIAVILFLPIYFATFVLMNLFAFPGLELHANPHSPLAEIADLRFRAIILRIPYLFTILCSLWTLAPRLSRPAPMTDPLGLNPSDSAFLPTLRAQLDPFTLRRFFIFVVAAGLLNALIAGVLLCHLPDAHFPTWTSVVLRASLYVALGAITGIMGAWIYWNNPSSPFRDHPPIPFRLFAITCAAGWVWVPAMVILSEQVSPATALIAMTGAFILAGGLRHTTASLFAPTPPNPLAHQPNELFSDSFLRIRTEPYGTLIALALYAGAWSIFDRSHETAGVLLALAGAVFAWQRTFVPTQPTRSSDPNRRVAIRLACVILPAIAVTTWSLLEGVQHRNRILAMHAAFAATDGTADTHAKRPGSGYESVILWPYPEKKQIVPPIPAPANFLAPGSTEPLILRFNGPYWYLQPPDMLPTPRAHQAVGTPLGVSIHSSNHIALTMQAHQYLSTPIRISRCREIQVQLQDQDLTPGEVTIALYLRNNPSPSAPAIYLGDQPIPSTEPGYPSDKIAPVIETLRFAVPAKTAISSFNEIEVMLLPDQQHALTGPKIAIRQFQLFPR